MMLPQLLAVTLALAAAPQLASAAIFPKGSKVKMIDAKGFREAMSQNMTSVVAFVAPWCGHCQKMAPEYSRAALGLYPLIPLYAVDCDVAKNKKLCADQGVQGFPTIKLFPRGKNMKSTEFNGPERSASAFFYWASRAVPHKIEKKVSLDDVEKWAKQEVKRPRALLLKKGSKMPLLWTVLGNKYRDDIAFGSHRDRRGKSSVKMGFEAGEDKVSKVIVYPVGETKPILYEGIMKYDSLSKFFDSVLDGTADLKTANAEAAAEEFIPNPEDLAIEKEQEAEMLKLAHGGYAEMIDFEKAIKEGHGKDFHAAHGYPGMMPGAKVPYMKEKDHAAGGSEGGIVESSMAQGEVPKPTKGATPMTDAAGQIVFDPKTETGQPRTPVAAPTQSEVVPEETPVTETASTEEVPAEAEPSVIADPEVETAEEDDVEDNVEVPAVITEEEPVEQAVPVAEEEAAPVAEETHVKDEL